jgi:phosphoribosylformimino-5-aminoimidazole carboxamide ribotide isomerase
MELLAAIDLLGGNAVRLIQGDFERQQSYGDPLDLAQAFVTNGARWIHVVDLDAARTGVPHQRDLVRTIVDLAGAAGVQVQCGGGVRTEDDVAALIDAGVTRVVMGTAVVETPEIAAHCARRWPGQVAIGMDYVMDEHGKAEALGHGWQAGTRQPVRAMLAACGEAPVGAVVATSIARDGMLRGPDVVGMRTLLGLTTFPVVASGGVSDVEDLHSLAALSVEGRRLAGVVVGKALVERRFTVQEGLAACAASD